MRYGFTGSRYLDPSLHDEVEQMLLAHLDGTEYTTGGQVGIDTYVLRRLSLLCPDAHHRVCVPQAGLGWDNPYLELADEVVEVPGSFRERNAAILDHTDRLLAFPMHPEDHSQSKRSGTWMTIRMAQQRDIPVRLHVLNP